MSHVVVDLHCVRTLRDIIVPLMQAATRLHSAACNGDIATVRRLMTLGHVDVNATDEVSCVQSIVFKCHWRPHNTLVGYSIQPLSWSHEDCNTLQWKDFSIVAKHINVYYVITNGYTLQCHAQHGTDILCAFLCYIMLHASISLGHSPVIPQVISGG